MAIAERFVSALAGGGGDGLTEGTAWTFAEMLTNLATGQRANVKNDGAYTAAASTNAFSGTGSSASLVFIVRGYTTTIGDGGRPTITAPAGNGTFNWSPANGIIVQDLILKGSEDGTDLLRIGRGTTLITVDVENTSATFAEDAVFMDGGNMIRCSVKIDTTDAGALAVNMGRTESRMFECAVKSSTIGIFMDRGSQIVRCLVAGVTTGATGILSGGFSGQRIIECTVFDFDDLIEVESVPTSGGRNAAAILNCILFQGVNGINNTDVVNKTKLILVGNAIGSVTGAQFLGLGDNDPVGTITLTANPFTASGADDFSLNNVAGGGALVRDAAFQVPALIP